jgi:purine-binding chemotaxis protein CheW
LTEASRHTDERAGSSPSALDAGRFLSFRLDDWLYGIPLDAVERVVRVVEITPLPKAPPIILGVIDLEGRILPVADIRGRFGLPARDLMLTDQLIIAHTAKRSIALLVDRTGDILAPLRQDVTRAEAILPHLALVAGVAKLDDGTLLIHDLDRFLSLEEEAALDAASAPEPEAEHAS